MTKAELVVIISERTGQTQKVVLDVIDNLTDVITETLVESDEKVVLTGFGTFEVRTRKERNGKNPRTGEEIIIPEQKSPAFKAGKILKEAIK